MRLSAPGRAETPVPGPSALPFHRWLFRKLTVRPARFVEAHYWYPIRQRARALPPVACGPRAGDAILLVLTTPASYLDAVWSAWSHQRYFERRLGLVVACDGAPPRRLIELCRRVLPGAEVLDARVFLRVRPPGRLARFAEHHVLAGKLRLIMELQKRHAVLYSDSDVLTLNSPSELIQHVSQHGGPPAYMQGEAVCEDPWIMERVRTLGLSLDPRLNSGLLWIPRGSLDAELAEAILAPWQPPARSHFTEQNTLAALIGNAGGVALPVDRYVANARRMFYFEEDVEYDRLACRHFVNLVRYRMYSRGLPILWKQAQAAEGRDRQVRRLAP
jgi:hypothetical protein